MSSYYDTNLIKKYTSNYTLYNIVVPKIDMHVICVDNSSKGGGGS